MGTGKTPASSSNDDKKPDDKNSKTENDDTKPPAKSKCNCYQQELEKHEHAITCIPLYSQFKNRKHCSCKNFSWEAYKINYFTVSPRYNSSKSKYIHVIEIRLQCHSCNLLFPLTFSFDRISEYRFGEFMKFETWERVESIKLNYVRTMLTFFEFENKIYGDPKKPKHKKFVSHFWSSLLVENAKVDEELFLEPECTCSQEQ